MSEMQVDRTSEHLKKVYEKRQERVVECLNLARQLRDATYDSNEEFREDLNILCDKLSALRDL